MTTLTASAAPAAGAPGLGRLVQTELLKLRTTRVWWGLLITGVLLAFVNAGLFAATAGVALGDGRPSPPPTDPAMLRSIHTGGFANGYIVTLCLGVLAMAGEYRHLTITPTLLAVPSRVRLVTAKLITYLLAGLAYGVVFVASGAVLGAVVLSARGYPVGLDAPGVLRAMVLSVIGCAVWAVFGLGIGTLITHQIVALLTAIGFGFLGPLLGLALQAAKLGSLAQYLPSQASAALVEGTDGGFEQQLLPWWGGGLVLLAYGLAFALLGAALTTRRDVT